MARTVIRKISSCDVVCQEYPRSLGNVSSISPLVTLLFLCRSCFVNNKLVFKSLLIATSAGGGITNLLFKLQGPKEEAAILVRIYGEDTDVLIDRERDNELFDELAW